VKLKPGDKAPLFEGKDQNGSIIKLSEYKGSKIILYFYPKDDTSGCTAEACNLRDYNKEFKKEGYVILGISSDTEKSHTNFIKKYTLPFALIADTNQKIQKLYGVWVEKNMFGKKFMGTARITFVIDEKGIITTIINKVNTKQHAQQLLHKE